MPRNNNDFGVGRGRLTERELEEHLSNKAKSRVNLQREHGRALESLDRAEAADRKSREL